MVENKWGLLHPIYRGPITPFITVTGPPCKYMYTYSIYIQHIDLRDLQHLPPMYLLLFQAPKNTKSGHCLI